jgi:hypothetical protein
METVAQTTTLDKSRFVYRATYGGTAGLAPLYGTLARDEGHLVFLADSGEVLFPIETEWYLYGQVHGEVGLAFAQAVVDTCRARAEREMLEASHLLRDQMDARWPLPTTGRAASWRGATH